MRTITVTFQSLLKEGHRKYHLSSKVRRTSAASKVWLIPGTPRRSCKKHLSTVFANIRQELNFQNCKIQVRVWNYLVRQRRRRRVRSIHRTYWRISLLVSVLEADALLDTVPKGQSITKSLKRSTAKIPWFKLIAARSSVSTCPAKGHRLIGTPKSRRGRLHRPAISKSASLLPSSILQSSNPESSWRAKPQLTPKRSKRGSKTNMLQPIDAHSPTQNSSNLTRSQFRRSCKHIWI